MRRISMTLKTPGTACAATSSLVLVNRIILVRVLRCAPMGDHHGHSLMMANGPKDLDETEFTNLILANGGPGDFKISRMGPGTFLIMADNRSNVACAISLLNPAVFWNRPSG